MPEHTLNMHPYRGYVNIRKREHTSFNDNHRSESTHDCSEPCFLPRETSRPKPAMTLPLDYHKTSLLWTPNVTLNKSQRLVQVIQTKHNAFVENKQHLRAALNERGSNYRNPTIKQRNYDSQQGFSHFKHKGRLVPAYMNESSRRESIRHEYSPEVMIPKRELDYGNYRHDDFEEQYALPIESNEDSNVYENSERGYIDNAYSRDIPKQQQKRKSDHSRNPPKLNNLGNSHDESLRQNKHSNRRHIRSRNRSNSSEDSHRDQHSQNKRKQRNTRDRKRDDFIKESVASSTEGHQIYAGQFENELEMDQEKDQDNNKSDMCESHYPLQRSIIHTVYETKLGVSNKNRQSKERFPSIAWTVDYLVSSNDPKHVFAIISFLVLMVLGFRVVGQKVGLSSTCPTCTMPGMKQYEIPDTENDDDNFDVDSRGNYRKRQYKYEHNDFRRSNQYSGKKLHARYPKTKYGDKHQRYSRNVPLPESNYKRSTFNKPSPDVRYQHIDSIHKLKNDGISEGKRSYDSADFRYHSHCIVPEARNDPIIAQKDGDQVIEELNTSEREHDESEPSNRRANVNLDAAEQYTSKPSIEISSVFTTNSGRMKNKPVNAGQLSSDFRSEKNNPTSASRETVHSKSKSTPSFQPVKSAINTVTEYFQTGNKGLGDFEDVMNQLHASPEKTIKSTPRDEAEKNCCGRRNGRKLESTMFERFNTFNSAIEDTFIEVKDYVLPKLVHSHDSSINKNEYETNGNIKADKNTHARIDDKDTIGKVMCRSKFSFLFKSCNI